MELFRGTVPKVKFYLPASTATVQSVRWTKDGIDNGILMHKPPANGAVEVQLPYLQHDGNLTTEWNFVLDGHTYTEVMYYQVVTPLLTKQEVLEIFETPLTDKEYYDAEAAVRHIINAHCGQTFGKHVGEKTVDGNARWLALPERMMALDEVNGNSAVDMFYLANDGFTLRRYELGVPPVKADYHGLHQSHGVIHNPNNVRLNVFKESFYRIKGTWGYDYVPATVKEAAKLLINDYACADSAYRDRYLTSMTAADWRIQFSTGAFTDTGNVRANQLLQPYVISRRWAVI